MSTPSDPPPARPEGWTGSIYGTDHRYPPPAVHQPPREVTGLPTQSELDAFPRMFTWGDLKGIIQTGDLDKLMRNRDMQSRYDVWMSGVKQKHGSTENYLRRVRLPWKEALNPSHPGIPTSTLLPGSNTTSNLEPPSQNDSGISTPSSAGFVSLESVLPTLNKMLRKAKIPPNGNELPKESIESETPVEDEEIEVPEFLSFDPLKGLDGEKYAVLENDWPYCVPYGVSHYCVWSRIPIIHPISVNYNPETWSTIEQKGLGGFTGVTPFPRSHLPAPGSQMTPKNESQNKGRGGLNYYIEGADSYTLDVLNGGEEGRKWAGVEYECEGGEGVGGMVRGLWDERGWECLWFVNPPRLQSIPGFSHFHVFARRKTPVEIDASERAFGGITSI